MQEYNLERYGSEYPRNTGFDPAQYCRWKLLIPKDTNLILEVGCGGGTFVANKPEECNAEVYGVDISEYSVDYCKKLNYYKEVKIADIEKHIPYPDDFFDVVYADQVLEHIQDPFLAVLEMKRVLKNEGYVIVNVPTPYNPCFWEDYTHIHSYVPRALDMLFKDADFRNCRSFYYPNTTGIYYIPRKLKNNKLALVLLKILTKIHSNKKEAVAIGQK